MTRNEQIEELRLAMRQTKDKRLFERYQAVFLHFDGKNNIEIADIIQRNRATVGGTLKRIKKGELPAYVWAFPRVNHLI